MESVTIKRSTNPFRSLMWLAVTFIPVVLFSYATYKFRRNSDGIVFGIIAFIFLLPAIIDFIANKMIRLKPAIILSEHRLTLSFSKGLYDSFAFLQIFQRGRKKIIRWQNITGFKLMVHYKYLTSYPNEGEGTASTTYSIAKYQLCIENKARNEDFIFSIHDLDRTPGEILLLCNQFLQNYKGVV